VAYLEPYDLRRIGANPDHWYPVAWSTEVKPGQVTGVQFAGEPIAVARAKSGKLFAMEDRCAHRQVPLHKGVVEGETLRCNYHGWTYDCAGACVSVPYLGKARLPNGVRPYPVREVDGLVFVCPGDPVRAEITAPSALGAMADRRYKTRRLNRDVDAHYTFMHENLLDMNHQFLHRRQMGSITAQCLGRRKGVNERGQEWIEVDYTFSRQSGRQSMGEALIVNVMRNRKANPETKKGDFTDLMTIATRYPYQDLRFWIGRAGELKDPALHVWLGYLPLDKEQKTNRTFGYLSVLRPPIPGLLDALWPAVSIFTEKIFTEDKDIVQQEQAAYDEVGYDRNNEIFPVIRELRDLLARNGAPPTRPTAVAAE
jgi:phenylpropionate dioxygenase-like ring-hydroxylating dioxygenase large terminal subunit